MKYIDIFSNAIDRDMQLQNRPYDSVLSLVEYGNEAGTVALSKPIPDDEIWYTSTNGNVVTPYAVAFGDGITVVSNTYANGKG